MKNTLTIKFLSIFALFPLAACLDTGSSTIGSNSNSGSFVPQSVKIEVDSDWDVASNDTVNSTDAVQKRHGGDPMPEDAAIVELSSAKLYIALVGFAQVTEPVGEHKHPAHEHGERPDGPPPGAGEATDSVRPEHRPHHKGAGPQHPQELPEFDNEVAGPLTIDLLGGDIPAELAEVALLEESRYVAFLFPVTGEETKSIYVSGTYANDETEFAFILEADLMRPLHVPIFSDEYSDKLTAHVRIAAALAHADLAACIDSENINSDGAYLLTDLKSCGIQLKHRRPRRQENHQENITVNCEGSDEWCASIGDKRPRREDVCVTDISRTEDSVTVTIIEPSDDCVSVKPPEPPTD